MSIRGTEESGRHRSRARRRRRVAGMVFALVVALVTTVSSAPPAGAASLTVTTAADVVADDGLCSLREAIEAADTDTASGSSAGECAAGSGADVITFGVAGPAVGGFFEIGSEVVIDGGPGGMVIDAGSGGVTFTGPVFAVGGGGHVTFRSVTITGALNNSILAGGGILNLGTTIVEQSTIEGNESGAGGAIASRSGDVTVVNSTLSNNIGGGLANLDSGTASVVFSTITGNEGSGISNNQNVTTTVTASIVAANTSDIGSPWGFTSGGFNVIGDGVGAGGFTAPGDVTGVADPGLGPLGDNGGPTHTHALLAGSPALDRVTAPVGSDPSVDQRGIVRPQGAAKDAGAFERDEVVLLPGGFGTAEGDSGSQVFEIPISLSRPSTETITVDYVSWPCEVFDGCGDGLATEGVDYESPAPGTLTFQPGEVTKTVPVVVYGDLEVEPVYLWGEWFLIRFLNPSSNAVLDSSFFGLGAGVIGSDDP